MQGPLSERLKSIAAHFCERLVEYSRKIDRLVARLHANDAVVAFLKSAKCSLISSCQIQKVTFGGLRPHWKRGRSFLPFTAATGAIIAT